MKITLVILFFISLFHVSVETSAQTSRDSLKREALKHMSLGRYVEAINLLGEFIAQQPQLAEGYNLRGVCREKRSELKLAVLDFRTAYELSPESREIRDNLARAEALWHQNLNKTIDHYKRELAIDSNLVRHYFAIGECYENLGNWKEAEIWYDNYFESVEASSDEIIRYAEILARNNQLSRGEQFLRAYIRRDPNNHRLLSKYGYFLMWLGEFDEAIKIFETALEIMPFYKEAQDGLNQAVYFQATDPSSIPARTGPLDINTRLKLVDELVTRNRFEEALDQIEMVLKEFPDTGGEKAYPASLLSTRERIYEILVTEYSQRLSANPMNRGAVLKLANYYDHLGKPERALQVLESYLAKVPRGADPEIEFRYAQHAAQHGQNERALNTINLLLSKDPANLDYQLLGGQIRVWTAQDLEQARIYLENVHKNDSKNINAIFALSSLCILKKDFSGAEEYLKQAGTINPNHKDIEAVRKYLDEALQAEAERKIYDLLEEGRRLALAGDCPKAVQKYEEYLSQVNAPDQAVLLEYADVNSCAKKLGKAIEVYTALLQKRYDFEIALLRAKNYLWNGDSTQALSEFKKLALERPDHFEAKLYCGDAYLRMQDHARARAIYTELLAETSDSARVAMIQSRFDYLPSTSLSGALATFPRPVALAPVFNQYLDNLGFLINHMGSGLELGSVIGASVTRANVQSATSSRDFTALKGRLSLRLSDHLTASAAVGMLHTFGEAGKIISDAKINYENRDGLSASLYYESNDAALILYSPHLVNIRYEVAYLRLFAAYDRGPSLRLSGYLSYLSISDGNAGNDFLIKIGRKFYDKVYLGYEHQYLLYKHQAQLVASKDGRQTLYYSPQDFSSHSLWANWDLKYNEKIKVETGVSLGYVPQVDVTIRKIHGNLSFQPKKAVVITGQMAIGSSYRFDSSYNYFSTSLSVYWKLH